MQGRERLPIQSCTSSRRGQEGSPSLFSPIPPVPEVALPLRRAARTLKSEFIFQLTLGTYCRYVCTFAGKYVYIYIGFCGVQRVVYVHIYSELLHMAPK